MRCGVTLQGVYEPAEWVELVRWIEELGYDNLWITDSSLHAGEVYVYSTLALQATSRLTVGTGVTNPITRTTAARASSTSIIVKPTLLVPCDGVASVSVGGRVGGLVTSNGMVGTNTGESPSSRGVWSDAIAVTLTSGWSSSAAPSSTVTWYVSVPLTDTSGAVQVKVGEKVTGFIEVVNDGTATWKAGNVFLAPIPRDQASPYHADTWASATRISTVAADVKPGEIGKSVAVFTIAGKR